jgi:F-type H+-transporting ATPase subunit delta
MTAPADFSSSVTSTEVDASARSVGVLYAKALYAAAGKAGALDDVAADFEAVMEVVETHPTWIDFSRSGMVSNAERAEVYHKAFDGKASALFVNFLRTVASHGRHQMLRAIFRAFREMNDERTGQVRIEVTTPKPLDDGLGRRLAEGLQKTLGRKPIFETKVNSDLIGGVMLRVGDTVYDGSVATLLENIRTQMIDRTVYEIQSRRDRFRITAGN